jgi:hypothetical protein
MAEFPAYEWARKSRRRKLTRKNAKPAPIHGAGISGQARETPVPEPTTTVIYKYLFLLIIFTIRRDTRIVGGHRRRATPAFQNPGNHGIAIAPSSIFSRRVIAAHAREWKQGRIHRSAAGAGLFAANPCTGHKPRKRVARS